MARHAQQVYRRFIHDRSGRRILGVYQLLILDKGFTFIDQNKVLFSAVFSDKHSLSFDTTLVDVITDFCALKLMQVLEGIPDYKAQIFSHFYSGSVIGVIKWYVKNYEICPIEDLYAFFGRRIDEICDAYIRYYLTDSKEKLI